MVDINKFMGEIIRLLTDLVQAVKVNEGLLRETQSMVENLSSGGMKGLASLSQGLQDSIALLQKGVQALGIQQALRQVQDFLGEMGGSVPATGSSPSAVSFQPPQQGQPQKKAEDSHLIKPSDLFG
jgi:hypothetical protein